MTNMLVSGNVVVPVLQIQEEKLNIVMEIPSEQEQVIVGRGADTGTVWLSCGGARASDPGADHGSRP